MIGYTDGTGYDWSGIAIKAQRLAKERDELLNLKQLKKAMKKHIELGEVELELFKWMTSKLA